MATRRHPLLEQDDPRVEAAQEAERRLFEHYGLDYKAHYIELTEPKIRIRVQVVGSGKPVLMVPGSVGDAFVLTPLMAQLEGYQMIAVNRPGGGMSEGLDHRAVDVRKVAVDTLSSVLDYFGLERVPIVGNSMGGLWSFWFALDRPERVAAVVQLGTPALVLDTSAPFPMRLMSVPVLNRLLVKKMMVPNSRKKAREAPAFLGHPKDVGTNWSEAEAECAYQFPRLPTFETSWLSLMERVLNLRGAKEDVRFGEDKLRLVQQPVLFIWGSGDPFGSLVTARRAQAAVPDAELHEAGVGHLPWWDDAEKCARLIRGFLAEEVLSH